MALESRRTPTLYSFKGNDGQSVELSLEMYAVKFRVMPDHDPGGPQSIGGLA